jgi:hypothetical protein
LAAGEGSGQETGRETMKNNLMLGFFFFALAV